MSFFDSKKDVLSINLTEYGRRLLSEGKFRPKYYSFFDDEIVYDLKYTGVTEDQNNIQQRILDNSLYSKPFNLFKDTGEHYKDFDKEKINHTLALPLGTSDVFSKYHPAWNIKTMKGEINDVKIIDSSSIYNVYGQNKNFIPQINMSTQSVELSIYQNGLNIPITFNSYRLGGYSNGIIFAQSNENIFDFFEENCEDKKENFEIEIFEIEEGTENLKKLSFVKIAQEIQNNILLDMPQGGLTDRQASSLSMGELDETFAESYFTILTDEQIPFERLNIERLDIYEDDINKIKPNKGNC
jgi:hypothetical protein